MNFSHLKITLSSVIATLSLSLLNIGCSENSDLSNYGNSIEKTATSFTCVEQTGWKYCGKCKCLFWGPSEAISHCYAGGNHESLPNSYVYTLPYNCQNAPASIQIGWNYCGKCKVLFWGPSKTLTTCPYDLGTHDNNASSTYGLLTQNDGTFNPVQDGWSYCSKCKNLFHGIQNGVCMDGQAHDGTNSSSYYLKYN